MHYTATSDTLQTKLLTAAKNQTMVSINAEAASNLVRDLHTLRRAITEMHQRMGIFEGAVNATLLTDPLQYKLT